MFVRVWKDAVSALTHLIPGIRKEVRIDAATESTWARQKTDPGIFLIHTLSKNQNKNQFAHFREVT